MKTDKQALLEAQRSKSIEAIVREALERQRDQKHQVVLAGLDLGVTDATLYSWCEDLGIDIDEYRRAAVGSEG